MSDSPRSRWPGPRRPAGSLTGPDEVRRAVLDAAAMLFALRGVDAVPLRDIAAAADVHLALIRLYVGTREELLLAVFDYLSDQVARAVAENPLPPMRWCIGIRGGDRSALTEIRQPRHREGPLQRDRG